MTILLLSTVSFSPFSPRLSIDHPSVTVRRMMCRLTLCARFNYTALHECCRVTTLLFFLRVSSINVATDVTGGLGEVDSGRVWQFGNQGALSDRLFIFPFPALHSRFYDIAFLSTLRVRDTNSFSDGG